MGGTASCWKSLVLAVVDMDEGISAVKVFSATKAKEREQLGDNITHWLKENRGLEIADKIVTQSSDREFHCLTITLFLREKVES